MSILLHWYVLFILIICSQCKLELQQIDAPMDHATAFGRIAFSCPSEEVSQSASLKSNLLQYIQIYII